MGSGEGELGKIFDSSAAGVHPDVQERNEILGW